MGAILMNLVCFNSSSLPNSQASTGSSQEQMRIPEISTAKIEKMIDVGGRELNCCVYGKGSPTVVLVSGLEAPQAYWNSVVPDLTATATVVTYDRAGVGKSELGGLPAHGERSARDLHVLLGKLGVPKPYILVGHSYGGSVARLFASLYPGEMGGLVLEDTQHEDVFEAMRSALTGTDLEAFDRLMAERFSTPEHPQTEADYRETTREQLKTSRPLPRIPYVVLASAGRAKAMAPLFSEKAIERLSLIDESLNDRLAALIPGGKLIVVEGTGHDIHVDKPDALITPVLEMIGLAGRKGRLGYLDLSQKMAL